MRREVTAEPGLSYDMVLEAVQESSRGRWFLNEFKSRNCAVDSGRILTAIGKLEERMGSLSQGGTASAELARVRQAIATARQDILQTAGLPNLSNEGRLFSHLADLARSALAEGKAPSGNEAMPETIAKALRLVDQIDMSLLTATAPPPAATFFGRDNDLFEPQPAPPKPALVAKAPVTNVATAAPAQPPAPATAAPADQPAVKPAAMKPMVETPPLGAKLVINRGKSTATETPKPTEKPAEPAPPVAASNPAPQTAPAKAEAPAPVHSQVHSQVHAEIRAESQGHPRIVIIRRNPEDMPAPVETENAA